MGNVGLDQLLSFGKLDTIAAGIFPDALNLGRVAGSTDTYPGKEFTSAGRLTVDLFCGDADGGTSVTVTVQGSADGSTGWMDVGKNTFTLEQMKAGPCQTAVSPGGYQYLRVNIATAGTFTGSAEAFLNTYTGK
jgi:hypothetical protein